MATPDRTIPQRTLRNESGRVLREVEAGARIRVTVHGRPVADLVPAVDDSPPRQFVDGEEAFRRLRALGPNPALREELARDAELLGTLDEF